MRQPSPYGTLSFDVRRGARRDRHALHVVETGTFGSHVIHERYRRAHAGTD
jgi:hypothetical protein